MEMNNNRKKLIKTKSEQESKIRSKEVFHYILKQGCKEREI